MVFNLKKNPRKIFSGGVPFSYFSVLLLLCLQVLYHVLGIVPAYQASIGPALNELCLGLHPDEVASVCMVVYH